PTFAWCACRRRSRTPRSSQRGSRRSGERRRRSSRSGDRSASSISTWWGSGAAIRSACSLRSSSATAKRDPTPKRRASTRAAGRPAHRAGMVPPMKEAVEEAFGAGLVKMVFATETLSLGINMPARSVVIEKLSKFTGEQHEFLTPGEYTQLTGRAGRRGIDDVGYAVVCWSPFVPFDQVASLASRRTYALRSSFRPTYNMAANLVQRYLADVAHHLL